MQQHLKDIRMGEGLGTLRFGITRNHVQEMLGAPTEKEKYALSDDEDDDDSEAWHYDELSLSLSFDELHDWRLSSIAVSSEDYTLEGIPLIGKSREEVLEEFRKRQWGEPEEDDEDIEDSPEHTLVHIPKASMSLWFENDELTEIQWGPFFKNDEILWPAGSE